MRDCDASLMLRHEGSKEEEEVGSHLSAGNLKRAYCVRLETDGEVGRWAAVKANASTLGIYIHGGRELQHHQLAIGKLDGFLGEWHHTHGEHLTSIGYSHSQPALARGNSCSWAQA